MKNLHIIATLLFGIALGAGMHQCQAESQKPVYLVVSSKLKAESEALEPYRRKARPLALAAGLEVLARGDVELLEGDWDHHPSITIEKFNSMAEFKAFWHSPEYLEAKKLRQGLLDIEFIVAVEGS
jgi:uncharacterized protein (DUF1330 family)